MTEHDSVRGAGMAAPSKTRKLIVQSIVGAIFGGLGMFGALWLVDDRGFDVDRLDHVLALGLVVVFLLMALMVALGTAAPRVGATMLNVEDETEIRHQRKDFFVGSAFFILLAIGLLGLALYSGPEGGIVSRPVAIGAVILSIGGQIVLGLLFKPKSDELNDLVLKETMAFVGNGAILLFGGWAVLSHLGVVAMFSPLALVAGLNAIFLLGLFVSLGRRGALS